MPVKPRIKFAPGKTYVYSGSEGVYSVIAGELLEGEGVTPSSSGLSFGNGSPISLNGKDGDIYLDLTDFKIHTKSAGSWSGGTVFKGTNGSNGTNGKSVRFGNGAPSSGLGDNDDVYFDLTDFKLHTKSAGSWSAGSAFKGANGAAGVKGASLLQGSSAPSNSAGDDGDTFLDAVNHTIYTKSGGVWASQGSSFKGTNGSNGTNGTNGKRGKTTLEGEGPPGTGTYFATGSAALTAALTAESMTSGDLEAGDLYLDTTNHKFYRKTAQGWTARTAFKGTDGINGTNGTNGINGTKVLQGSSAPGAGDGDNGDTFIDATNHKIYKKTAGSWAEQGSSFKGASGADGAGVSKFSCALSNDTYLSTGGTQSASTTAASSAYPAILLLEDPMESVGGVVTRTRQNYKKNILDVASSLSGSMFTINTAGRYKIEYNATFNVQADSASSNSVPLTGSITYSTDSGATYTTLVSQIATMTTTSTTAAQTTLELSKTVFLPASSSLFFKASRGASTVNTTVSVNAITKTEVGDDTFIVITKL